MATLYTPPNTLPHMGNEFNVFFAGTIELGKSEDWQTKLFKELDSFPINVLNPRRVVYDESDIVQQITWELDAMESADVIIMHFEPDTKSPITLLELGLWAKSDKLIVHCPDGFWRKTNVAVTCEYYGVKMVQEIDDLVNFIVERYKELYR